MANTIQGNTLQYSIVKQTSPSSGVPSTPTFTTMRRGSGDIDKNPSFTKSNEVDSSRQASSNVLTQFAVEGSFEGEYPVASPDLHTLIESAVQNEFSADLGISATTISFDNATSEIRDSGNGFGSVVEGQYVGVFNTANQTQEVFLVTTKTSNGVLVVAPAPVDEAAGATVDIVGQNVRNNKNQVALTVQKRIPTDASTTEYRTFTGVQVNTLSLNLTASSLLTTSFGMIGLDQEAGTSAVAGQTDNAESTANVIGSVNGVPDLWIDDVLVNPKTKLVTDATIDIDNGGEGTYVVGGAGAVGISYGAITVGGNFSTYVDGTDITSVRAEKTKADNETEFSLGISFKDSSGNYIVLHRPNCQYTALTQDNTANGELLLNTGTIDANGKGTAGYTIQATYIAKP